MLHNSIELLKCGKIQFKSNARETWCVILVSES